MDNMVAASLQEALELLRAGKKEDANDILIPIVQQDPQNANAWYLLGFTLDDSEKRLYCFQQVLRIDPSNRAAQKQVALLTAPPPAPAPETFQGQPAPVQTPVAVPPRKLLPKMNAKSLLIWSGVGIGVVLLLALFGWGAFYFNDGMTINNQVNSLFVEKKCTEVLQYDSFGKTYPRALFSSTFGVYHQVEECQARLALEQAIKSQKWSAAYDIVQNYIVQHPRGAFISEMSEQAGSILLAWSNELMAEKDYKTAIAKLNLVQKGFAASSAVPTAVTTMLNDYLLWAKNLFENGDYEGAEKTLKIVGWHEKATPEQVKQADNALVVVYISWANAQIKNGEYEKGVQNYDHAKEINPTAADYDRLKNQVALVQVEALVNDKKFDKALDRVNNLLQSTLSEESKADVLAEQTKVLNTYAYSDSAQAEDQITLATTSICNKEVPTLPIFAIDAEKIRVRMGAAFNFDLGDNLNAKSPAELHYVVCVKQTQVTIQTCPYENYHTFRRHLLDWQLTLYDITTAKPFKTTSMKGGTPRACGSVELFYSNDSDIFGSQPKTQAVIDWLNRLKIFK